MGVQITQVGGNKNSAPLKGVTHVRVLIVKSLIIEENME